MKTAVDLAEDFTDTIFDALMRSEQVTSAVPSGSVIHRRRHAIDSAGFDTDGSVTFDGEFDFHYGPGGDAAGHPALRANVQGLLVQDAAQHWAVRQLTVESLDSVDAGLGPDEPGP